ncbi:MAG: hypothetical protein NZ899_11325 [Thermoguttaceae bacterium]|nr:hypothetical protein [Thermoguttaceae bacterium]MDW8077783.1 hypothetical protein [Thermoguttaceae bacterium]
MSPLAEPILRRLEQIRQQWWLFSLMTAIVLGCALSGALLLIFVLIDAIFALPQTGLAILAGSWLAITLVIVVAILRRAKRNFRSLEATARRIEAELPELESNLINVVQLAFDTKNVNREFVEAALADAAAKLRHVNLAESAYRETRWRRFIYAMNTPRDFTEALGLLALVVCLLVLAQVVWPNASSAASRLMRPWEYVPLVGTVRILSVTPGDTEVLAGSSVEISAVIAEREGTVAAPAGRVVIKTPGESEQIFPLTSGEPFEEAASEGGARLRRRYSLVLPAVVKPFHYRVEIGDSQSRFFQVTIGEKPVVSEVEVTLRYPAYMNRPERTFAVKEPDLEGPQFSTAELKIRPSVPIVKGHISVYGETYVGRVEQDGNVLRVNLPLLRDGTFTIHLFTRAGHTDPNPRVNRIRVIPDNPPRVEILKPPKQIAAAVGDEIPIAFRASDDHGLGKVRLEMLVQTANAEAPAQSEEASTKPVILREWTDIPANTAGAWEHTLKLLADSFSVGQTVRLRAVAVDKRQVRDWGLDLRPQETASPWHEIRLEDPQQKKQERASQLGNLRVELFRILEKQIRANAQTARLRLTSALSDAVPSARGVRDLQVDIQKSTLALVKGIGADSPQEHQKVKPTLSRLAFGEMLEAINHAEELARSKSLEVVNQTAEALLPIQKKIIDTLRQLLDQVRTAEMELVAELGKRRGDDLPDETRKKFEELEKKLEAALEAQRRVVEAAENLAKAPVEDFTEAEEQLIKALAAAEDEWSRFLTELSMDLSKLPEQDFANPSLLKELIEIQTEIKMAEDALLKKTVDIAVPLEQLGYEMAEELKTNLEKWLPDTPDRERWSQEESLTDQDKEAPMAELPGELEDLIGELMEEEEALFDEMEDVSSSAADSLDAGAGWDALDGPISNMSAKGVTGNRLPNTNEIGGRSGEGRSGKASGEMVGEEAVGKGGRRTPSRLTPDPYMKGQIKDHSRDPVGGATGGGKESGEGGAGLEGPPPPQRGERDRHRLAGKQAALRNKAEAIDLQFQVMNFHRTDLQRLIELMRQVEADIRAGRYQNALRQRQIMLEGLRDLKQYVAGEFQVRQDYTPNLPADVQKEILGSMQEPSPPGWEELNRQYFERLSTTGQR